MTIEKQTIQRTESENAQEGTGAGNQPEATSVIESANRAAERLEAANAEAKRENDRRESLQARERLGGKSFGAGQIEPPKVKSDRDYAREALEGKVPSK